MRTHFLRTSALSLCLVLTSFNFFKSQILVGKMADIKIIISQNSKPSQLTTNYAIFSAELDHDKIINLQLNFKSRDLKSSNSTLQSQFLKIINTEKDPYISLIVKSNSIALNKNYSVKTKVTIKKKSKTETVKINVSKVENQYIFSGTSTINLLDYGIDFKKYNFNNSIDVLFNITTELLEDID